MKLVLFDIDGTLVDSHRFDADSYILAAERVLGLTGIDDEWSHYEHVTDPGVLAELYRMNFSREIEVDTVLRFITEFMSIMRDALQREGRQLEPIPGAVEAFDAARRLPDCMVGLATGCWRVSALFKLESAGFDIGDTPLFTSDECLSRDGIMENAIRKMSAEIPGPPDKITYVGDGVWDLEASRRMGLHFIAIGERWKQLERAGASHAFPDFNDLQAFIDVLTIA